ncbi:hypothetical protein [Methylobacterium sp. J-030]|uniref:hypothetical protein n=1 Tax=Methylobacterium sp. J-030 TaxID=2836627 RepID=UPI001FBA390E|nr:hypothetical protein [Methylobacterium sp. J-030]
MIYRTLLVLVPVILWLGAAPAQEPSRATACETLLAARRVDAASGSGHPAESEPGCRGVDRTSIGSVEQRALIGGAPYECMTIAGAKRCLWIVP